MRKKRERSGRILRTQGEEKEKGTEERGRKEWQDAEFEQLYEMVM
jgi:hypothetical protein